MVGDFDDLVSRLRLTPAGVVRGVVTDPQKAAKNLAKCGTASSSPSTADRGKRITPEQALTDTFFENEKMLELLIGEESHRNSDVWRVAANKPLPYRYVNKMFGTGWWEYWTRRILGRLILLVVATGAIVLRPWIRAHAFKQAAGVANEVFPVWAAQGPFQSGAESAAAMRYAYTAVKGPEEVERMANAIAKHASAYDSDPTTWERIRQEVTQKAGVEAEIQ